MGQPPGTPRWLIAMGETRWHGEVTCRLHVGVMRGAGEQGEMGWPRRGGMGGTLKCPRVSQRCSG